MPPLRVLVIARWYPAVDDPVRGSFVADQVAALVATGRVDATVVSFEFVRLNRVAERREPEREAIHRRYGAALGGRDDVLTPGGWPGAVGTWPALAAVPVARLPVASGAEDSEARGGDDHLAAFTPFLARLAERTATRPGDTTDGPPVAGEGACPALFDLVHAHTGFPDGELAALAAARLGVPYVVTEHSSRTGALLADPDVRARYARVLRGAARVIVVSSALGAEIRDAMPEMGAELGERLEVVPNTVPVELFRAPPRADRRRGELLYVGARKPDKGIATLLEAFALARTQVPELTLRMVGRAPTAADEDAWRARAVELGVADAVAFDPPVDRAGVADAMARADLFVHPSRRETFGVVAVEALASGLPVVATRSGGVDEILGPDPHAVGALVEVDDTRALADGILETWARRDSFDPAALRAGAEARFAAPAVAERLTRIYDAAVAGTGGVHAGRAPAAAAAREGVGVPADRSSSSAPAPAPLVVGFNRVQAARLLSPLPPELLRRLTLVTVEDPGDQPLPGEIGSVVAADLDAGHRAALESARPAAPPAGLLGRALRFARDPGASDRIAAIHARRTEHRLETASERVVEEARKATGATGNDTARRAPVPGPGGTGGALADLLCLDGYDVLAASAALDLGLARLAPGGVRWLADRWAAGLLA
jgi:glycogen(starch) synthase